MPEKINVINYIIDDVFDRLVALRFDMCKCGSCKAAIVDEVVRQFPPYYADKDSPDYRKVFLHVSDKYFKQIVVALMKTIDFFAKNPPHKLTENAEEGFKMLLEKIYQDRGVDFSQYYPNLLKRRIAIRLRANHVESYSDYLKVLADNPQEYASLFEVMTINVSEFFRDLSVWSGIAKIMEDFLFKNKHKSIVRIWSAACAYGEEAYSLAILVKELASDVPVEIYATDIDSDAIDKARNAVYDVHRLKNVSKELLKKYFIPAERGNYALCEDIKKMVAFKQRDLINDTAINNIDLILCRNVFIYFTKPLQEQILNKYYLSLKDSGYLVIGKSESIINEARLIFKIVDIENRIYQKLKIKEV